MSEFTLIMFQWRSLLKTMYWIETINNVVMCSLLFIPSEMIKSIKKKQLKLWLSHSGDDVFLTKHHAIAFFKTSKESFISLKDDKFSYLSFFCRNSCFRSLRHCKQTQIFVFLLNKIQHIVSKRTHFICNINNKRCKGGSGRGQV